MHRSIRKSMLVILMVVLLGACGQAAPPATSQGGEPATIATTAGISSHGASHGGPVRDHVSLIDHLRGRGLTVEPIGEVQQPFLRAKGTTLRLSRGELKQPAEIQSYDYNDTGFGNGAAAAEEDAAGIGPDGNPRTMMISWVASPHFFRKERAFVIYVGDDPAVLKILAETLGPQFAGR